MATLKSRAKRTLVGAGADTYTLLISLASAVGFALHLIAITYVDSHYANPVYGFRSYPMGYYVSLFCIPEFYLTYRLTVVTRSLVRSRRDRWGLAVTRSVFALIVPLLIAVVLLFNFLPELPHLGLVQASFVIGAFTSTGTYIHNMRKNLDFAFVTDARINADARIETLKLTHATWYDMLKLILTGYVGMVGLYLIYGFQSAIQLTGQPSMAFAFTWYGGFNLIYLTIFLILGIAAEVLRAMFEIQDQLVKIKSS